MIRPWEKFTVIDGQIAVEHLHVMRRERGCMIIEIGTRQKYPEIGAWSGSELLIMASERTRKDSYSKENMATCVIYPRAIRGWDVISPISARYTLYVAFYKPARLARRYEHQFQRQAEQWRIDFYSRERS